MAMVLRHSATYNLFTLPQPCPRKGKAALARPGHAARPNETEVAWRSDVMHITLIADEIRVRQISKAEFRCLQMVDAPYLATCCF
jgi:hypothetical protein